MYARKDRREGQVAAAFLVGYGAFRFIAEYFREPDSFLGLLAMNWSMGQWLSIPMVVVGIFLWRRKCGAFAGERATCMTATCRCRTTTLKT
jgi:phosphatidylglycerol:prolipoprotein diacylglycerol transferase